MSEHSGAGVPGKRGLNRDRKVRREALAEERLGARGVDLETARAQAGLIANPVRQKLMLDALDELERTRRRLGSGRDRSRRQREEQKRLDAEREFIEANMTRIVTDELGRKWALAKDLPDGSIFVDGGGFSWRYIEADRFLTRIGD